MTEKEYIEREAAFNTVAEIMSDHNIYHKHRAIKKRIKRLPAAEVTPVRHGRWANEETAVTCTACGRSYDTDFEIKRNVILSFDFCPNCGAKMDGDSNAELLETTGLLRE